MVSPEEGVEPSPSPGPDIVDGLPFGGLVDDLFNEQPSVEESPPPSVASPSARQYKPKGLFLGARRDTGEPIDIAPVSYTHLTLPTKRIV